MSLDNAQPQAGDVRSMLSFGVSSLQRFKLVSPIELKPTLLVGRNSRGKSCFLRAFPLLRQLLTTRISSPILAEQNRRSRAAF